MKTTLVIALVVIEIVSCKEVVYAQISPGRHSEQVQQENRATACEEDNTFFGLSRSVCQFLRTFSPPPSSGRVTSENKPSSNFSPPSDSRSRRNSTPPLPPVTDNPKYRNPTGHAARGSCLLDNDEDRSPCDYELYDPDKLDDTDF
jgi:hypothetical protein